MKGAHSGYRREIDRSGPSRAKDPGFGREMRHVAEAVCTYLIVGEGIMISYNGAIVVGARGDIAEVCGRQRGARQRLEFHDVKYLIG